MKRNSLVLLLSLVFSCNYSSNSQEDVEEIKSLRELVNEGYSENVFYHSSSFHHGALSDEGLVLILPSSSCFNCFEDVNTELKKIYEARPELELIVIRNSKIKDREIYYSLQGVTEKSKIHLIDINEIDFTIQHEFFPKVGCYLYDKLCCLEIFEQENKEKLKKYFEFIDIIM